MVAGATTAVMADLEAIAATVAIADITAVDGIEAGVAVDIVTGMAGTGTADAGVTMTKAEHRRLSSPAPSRQGRRLIAKGIISQTGSEW